MTRTHRISAAHFDALAAGGGNRRTVALLRQGQLSKHTLLIHAIIQKAARTHPAEHAAAHLDEGYALLTRVQRDAPDTVAATLLHPRVGAWAIGCLRRLRGARTAATPLWADLAHLGAIAAAVAIRAGCVFEITTSVSCGTVVLPTLGEVRLGTAGTWGTAIIRGDTDGVEIAAGHARVAMPADPHADGPGWRGLRLLQAVADERRIIVELDDLGRFDSDGPLSRSSRVGVEEAAQWQRALDEGWALLVRHHPRRAEELSMGLSSLVPLAAMRDRSISATSTAAGGAVASSMPLNGTALAVTLVHEFQHTKLGALLDLVPLYRPGGDARYYAPWRDDPRPLGGLLQGAYAHLGITDFWRLHRFVADGSQALRGHVEFARWRAQLREALTTLAGSGEFTAVGLRFLAGMSSSLARWEGDQVPAAALTSAHDAAARHQAGWQRRNLCFIAQGNN